MKLFGFAFGVGMFVANLGYTIFFCLEHWEMSQLALWVNYPVACATIMFFYLVSLTLISMTKD